MKRRSVQDISCKLRPRRSPGGAAAHWLAGALFCCSAIAFAPHAGAQQADPAAQIAGMEVSAPSPQAMAGDFSLSLRDNDAPFAPSDPAETGAGPQAVELQLSLGHGQIGAPLDVAFAQRGLISPDDARQAHGSEVRVGRGLVASGEAHDGRPSVYAFVSSDNQALTWRPGQRSEFGGPGASVAIQNQVQVGDRAAGVAYERDGVQASLAYVERTESTRVGKQRFSQDQNFAGVTLTIRH